MKLTFLFLLAGLLQLSASVYSQTTKLSLEMRDAKVAEVLDAIENQSEFRFAYSPGLIDLDRKVTVKIRDKTIDESLKEIFAGTQVEYSVYDRHILLYPESMSPDAEPLVSHATGAQQRTVSGKVTDDTGQPLPGVTIVIKGTTRGTVTNADGEYSISSLPEDATLVFSFVGMRGQEVVVGSQASMDIVMEEDIIGLDEVVAIGYGTVKKSDLTGAVERVNTEDFNTKSLTNVVEALAGTVSGLYSVQGTSAAGGGSIEIRGTNSLAANINPLIVLDGVIYSGTIRDINPNDIESIDILKDASSTAVFGSRSASGVIVITTKKGRETKPTINFSTKLGIVGLTKHLYPFGPDEYLQLKVDYFKRMKGTNFPEGYFENPFDLPPGLTLEEWKNFDITPTDNPSEMWMGRLSFSPRETENYLTGKTFDWYDKIINNGIRQDYDLSVSGGLENLQYYFSAGYLHNKGFEMGDEFKT
ncbi:MAG: carboxypeptidase-like regulatory domain-containing protein, partial [Mariniphaga sp.]|nr:carboxypeptidase-like regulatory domain-containing protein [Mariniphaga sp.]